MKADDSRAAVLRFRGFISLSRRLLPGELATLWALPMAVSRLFWFLVNPACGFAPGYTDTHTIAPSSDYRSIGGANTARPM